MSRSKINDEDSQFQPDRGFFSIVWIGKRALEYAGKKRIMSLQWTYWGGTGIGRANSPLILGGSMNTSPERLLAVYPLRDY